VRLWDWAVAAYGRPGAADACLRLQDEDGQNTCLLLFAAWARTDDPAVLGPAAETARLWDAAAISPLRAARRALKAPLTPFADEAREGLRVQVKAAELAAERVLLETLERLAPSQGRAEVGRALTAAVAAWGVPADGAALAALARTLD
jgi:uncharacterized protein (TIGR02444 family)